MSEEEEEGLKGTNRVTAEVAANRVRDLCQEQVTYPEVTTAPSSVNLVQCNIVSCEKTCNNKTRRLI
jgi:hypothetical protein